VREWLKNLRTNKNSTMLEVSKQAGISESYYSMIESGSRNVSVEVAKRIAAVLDFDWTRFYQDEDELTKKGTKKGNSKQKVG
jgi:putative transcriptional regulator